MKLFKTLLVGALGALAFAAQAQINLRVADVQANTAYEQGLQSFAKRVDTATQGRVKVQVFAGTQLGNELDLVKQVRQGTLDMAQVGLTGYDKFQLLYIPYLFDPGRMMDFFRSDTAKGWRESMLKDWNVDLLEYVYFGPRHITANRAVTKPEDLKGIKIRVPQFPTMVDAFTRWNANVVAMPVGEIYISLQTGALDAQENPLNFIVSTSLFEVQKHVSLTSHVQSPRFLMINHKSLERLTPADQQAVRKAASEAAQEIQARLLAEEDAYLKTLRAMGMTVHEVNVGPFVAAARDVGRADTDKIWGPGVLDKIRTQYGPKN